MTGSPTPPAHRPRRQPTPAPRKSEPRSADDAPSFTPAAIARSELGRHYWGARQQRHLLEELAAAEHRMAGPRRLWRAAQQMRREQERKSWLRRRELAQKAKAAAPAEAADGKPMGSDE